MNSFRWIVYCIKCDIIKNKKNSRGIIFAVLFRLASCYFFMPKPLAFVFFPFRIIYSILIQYIMGIDISSKTSIGPGIVIYHGIGLVIHPNCKIGSNVIFRQSVTVGQLKVGGGVPTIGDNVEFGCNSVVLGDVIIGDNVKIGACCFVISSVKSDCVIKKSPDYAN